MKKFLLLIAIVATLWQTASAGQDSDTLWTKDLWQVGSKISQVQFMSDGQSLAVAIGNGVSIFNVNTSALIKRFSFLKPANDNECYSFAFIEDETKLVTSHNDNTIIVWDYAKADTIRKFNDISLNNIKIIDSNTIIGIGNAPVWNKDSIRIDLLNINSGKIIRTKGDKYLGTITFDVLKEHNLMAVITVRDFNNFVGYVELWDLSTLTSIATLGTLDNVVNDLAFSSDGKYLASASDDGVIKVWDITTKSLIKTLVHKTMQNGHLKIKFSPNNGYLVSSGGTGSDFNTKIWELNNFNLVHQYPAPFGAQYALDLSSDSLYIAVGRSRTIIMLNSFWNQQGIAENPKESFQLLFPNPSGGEINIPIEQGMYPKSINLFNMSGRVIKTITHFEPMMLNIKVDISTIIPGVYFVLVVYPTKTVSFKFEKGR